MVEVKNLLLSARAISEAVGADLFGENRDVTNVQIDSRNCIGDSLFVPLEGENTDGHFFIESAVEKGSSLCFVYRRFFTEHKALFASFINKYSVTFLPVEDCLKALQDLAQDHLRRQRGLTVIGITGSNGKTTTKEILRSILSKHQTTMANPGNLNSEIGLPLAIMEIREEHRFAVLEMGVNRPGEMQVLADIARPEFAAVTNIGIAHIGLLGSRQAIAAEKALIFQHIDRDGCGFVGEDDPFVEFLSRHCSGGVEYFGYRSTSGFEGVESLGLRGNLLKWRGRSVVLPLIGRFNVHNALCAISVALRLGVSEDAIARGLEDVRPLFGRGQVLKGAFTVVQDCYNANTDSMIGAMEFIDSLAWTGRKILVLGSMKELGIGSEGEHRRVGRYAADSDADAVFFFGEESAAAYEAAREESGSDSDRFSWTADFAELERRVSLMVGAGDLVLLKGSRSVELERLSVALAGRAQRN